MKQSRTRLSLAIISGILPLFFMLALIVPLWIFFTGERYFLSTLLHFAEVPLTDNPAQAPGMARRLLLLALLYLPAGLFAFAIWQGMKVLNFMMPNLPVSVGVMDDSAGWISISSGTLMSLKS